MKFHIENFGPIKKADVEWGNLTIVCGQNNTGKSYITYTMYCFFKMLTSLMSFSLPDRVIRMLMEQGEIQIDLADYIPQYLEALQTAIPKFLRQLSGCMAMHPDKTKNTKIAFEISPKEILNGFRHPMIQYGFTWESRHFSSHITTACQLTMKMVSHDSSVCIIRLNNMNGALPAFDVIAQYVNAKLPAMFNTGEVPFPKPFVITCERTGANLVRKVLTMLNDLSTMNEHTMERRMAINRKTEFLDYQLPVRKDIDFTLGVSSIIKDQSNIEKDYPKVMSAFEKIVGGKYQYDDQTNQVFFFPDGTTEKLRMEEASSTVRSMMELYFYLKHQARYHDLLIIDEPEQNLHPGNQRRLARFLAMLANMEIKVLVTTHSDYIIREFNTLIMLNAPRNKRLKAIAEELGYDKKHDNCLLASSAVRCYVVKDGIAIPMDISSKYGMEVTSFDDTINEVNALQQRILYEGN